MYVLRYSTYLYGGWEMKRFQTFGELVAFISFYENYPNVFPWFDFQYWTEK